MERYESTTRATTSRWFTWAVGLGLLWLAYQLQESARPWILEGSPQQQYHAHFMMTLGWVVGFLAASLLVARGQHRLVKQFVWSLAFFCCLAALTNWFQHRHQRAVPLGNWGYQIINP